MIRLNRSEASAESSSASGRTSTRAAAQKRHAEVINVNRTSFCGAYWGYGFHEDGLASALRACRPLGGTL